MEDMVSVFESTQNQPWSVFSGKLNGISIETCKSKNIFKSENPIQLSLKNDFRVFGLIPRLEDLKLVSCKKCKMIVKEDCLLHHYNHRHRYGNDTFSLKNFLRPTINSNKHKRQKLNNIRKLTKTKLINGKIIGPIVQQIKTEFDELEFDRLSKIKLEKLVNKTENKCNDKKNLNVVIETCDPVPSNLDFDWNIKQCTQSTECKQSLDSSTDNQIEECDVETNKLLAELPDDKEELHFHKYGSINNFDNTINYMISSYDSLTKPLILNEELKMNMLLNLETEKKPKDKFKNPYCILGGLLNNENIKFTRDYYSNVICDNKICTDVITHNQYTIDEIIDDPLVVNNQLDVNNDNISCDSITNLHSSLNNEDNQYSKITSNNNENNEIVNGSQNQCFQLLNTLKKIKNRLNYISSDKYSYVISNENFLSTFTSFHQLFTESSKFRNENTIICKRNVDVGDRNKNKPCQLSIEYPVNKTLTEFPPSYTCSKGTSDKYIDINPTSNNYPSIIPYSVKEVSKLTFNYKNNIVMLNEYSNNAFKNYGQSLASPIIDIIKSSDTSLLTDCKGYKVDDHYSYREYNHSCKSIYDEEENCKINDQFFNSYTLPSELQNYKEKTHISPINDESSVVTNNTEESKPKSRFDYSINMIKEDDNNDNNGTQSITHDKNEYYYLSQCINSDVSSSVILSNYDYSDINNEDSDDSVTSCDQSSIESLDIDDETYNLLSNATSDESCGSDTSQSSSETLDVSKEKKSVQNELYIEHKDYEPSIDSMSKVGGSLIQLLNNFENNTNCTPTDIIVDGRDNSEMYRIPVNSNSNVEVVKDCINSYIANSSNDQVAKDSYISIKSNALASESSVNGFTSVSSNAKIINNTIIPISTEKCREKYELIDNNTTCNHSTSNSSHNTSYSQQIPFNTDNQNDHLTNCKIHNPIIDNNDKACNSEPCTNKQNDSLHHDTSGSSYHPIFKDCFKKAADETIVVYGKNYKINSTVTKIKKNLKKRYAVKVPDDKENHKLWKYGTFKKRRRLEFIVRKIKWSDESDYNDNVSE